MKNKWILIVGVIAVILIIGLFVCYSRYPKTSNVVSLVNVSGGSFVESAGLYEGSLSLKYTKTGQEYSLFVCYNSWDWVKEGSCYKFDEAEIEKNKQSHITSAELSGCYVGTLELTEC